MICHVQHVFDKQPKFSTSWSSHRSDRNKPDNKDVSERTPLSHHYSEFHDIINKPPAHEAHATLLLL